MIPLARWAEFVGLAIRNLLGYPLRSFLTTLGVVFGIASVVTMLALGRGAEEEILRQIDQMGITNVIVNSVKPPEDNRGSAQRNWISRYGITFDDLKQIEETVPALSRVLPVHSYTERAWHGSTKQEVVVHGVMPDHFEITRLPVARGRGFTVEDELSLRRVCVVHLRMLRALGYYGDPLGYRLTVGDLVFEVVGLLRDEEFTGHARKALSSTERGENEIYVPYSTVIHRKGTMSISRKSGSFEATNVDLNQLVLEVDRQENVVAVARMVRAVMERFHEVRDWEIVVPLELLAQRQKTQAVFNIALLLIAGISLLVGGIGIANIMLATVTERTREIGVRRAIGAKRRHIVGQFLTETVTLSAVGGVLGVLLGMAGVELLRWRTGWEARFTPDTAFVALAVSCLVGILSGLFPAWRASRLDPIQALRYE